MNKYLKGSILIVFYLNLLMLVAYLGYRVRSEAKSIEVKEKSTSDTLRKENVHGHDNTIVAYPLDTQSLSDHSKIPSK